MKKFLSLVMLLSIGMAMEADCDRCPCNKPKPLVTKDNIQDQIDAADEAKCNTCNTCTTCTSCGCKTELTQEEEQDGTERCACSGKPGYPKPTR